MRELRLAFHHSHEISVLVIAGELHECLLPEIERSLRANIVGGGSHLVVNLSRISYRSDADLESFFSLLDETSHRDVAVNVISDDPVVRGFVRTRASGSHYLAFRSDEDAVDVANRVAARQAQAAHFGPVPPL